MKKIKKSHKNKKLIILPISLLCILLFSILISELLFNPSLDYGADGADTSMLIIHQGVLYGYADSTGHTVILPQYFSASPFYEGLACVRGIFGYGYINKSGKVVIPFKYSSASEFHNGNAIVGTESKTIKKGEKATKCYVIDINGNTLNDLGYLTYHKYVDGVYIISRENEKFCRVLDDSLNEIGQLSENVSYYGFSEGFAGAYRDGKEYFVNQYGKQAFSDEYRFVCPFSNGLASVETYDTHQYGYIDMNGKMVIQPQYEAVCPFGEEIACVLKDSDGWIIIDTSGKKINSIQVEGYTPSFMSPQGSFSDGICVVDTMIGMTHHYGYIDTSGKCVIKPIYDEAGPFKNGVAEVIIGNKIAYIDKTGKYIWGPK